MSTMRLLISIITTFFLFTSFTFPFEPRDSESNWKLKRNEEGIKIFTRDKSGSNLKELRMTSTIQSSISAFLEILANKKKYTSWIYKCSEAYLLKEVSSTETYHYQVTDAPWPVEDRDLVLHSVTRQNEKTKVVEVEVKGVPDFAPVKDDKVRVREYYAKWIITPKANNELELEYLVSLDPGGSLPAWIINMAVTEGPMETMKNIKKRLPALQSVKLDHIKE